MTRAVYLGPVFGLNTAYTLSLVNSTERLGAPMKMSHYEHLVPVHSMTLWL